MLVPVAVPPGVVMTTLTAPAAWAGVVAVIEVSLTTVNEVAAVPSKVTEVSQINPVPVIVTEVPPAIGPATGLMVPKVGTAAYLYALVPVAVPPGVVTITLTAPAA